MKKNRMMRTACMLLAACLVTCSMCGATFAKYTTQSSASDNARTAKWGVTLQVIGSLYGESYQDTIVANDATGITVQSIDWASADDFIVAPGTSADEGFHISLTGTPEVATQATVKITAQNIFLNAGVYGLMVQAPDGVVDAENFEYLGALYIKSGNAFALADTFDADETYFTMEDTVDTTSLGTYYPVLYSMEGDTTYSGDDSKDTVNEMALEIAKRFAENNDAGNVTQDTDEDNITTYEVTSAVVPVNTDLDDYFKADDLKIAWAWEYSHGTGSGDKATVEDKADTILGLLMNRAENGHTDALDGTVVMKSGDTFIVPTENTHFCLDTSFSVDITVEQVD